MNRVNNYLHYLSTPKKIKKWEDNDDHDQEHIGEKKKRVF